MSRAGLTAAVLFAAAVAGGTWLDARAPLRRSSSSILVADLHVHPYPGDGSLPVWELQHEAWRRGLDVIAVTGHNNRFGLQFGRIVPLDPAGPIVLPGQEITSSNFHMTAVGIPQLVDWRLGARAAIAAIHAQGGVAIAAHPTPGSWRDRDIDALRAIDGTEVAHQSLRPFSTSRELFEDFFRRVQSINPNVSPIGSSDFHMAAPMGLCRTYLLVSERSAEGALDAIRSGRTVARDARGMLFGAPDHIAAVEAYLSAAPPAPAAGAAEGYAALLALLALAALAVVY